MKRIVTAVVGIVSLSLVVLSSALVSAQEQPDSVSNAGLTVSPAIFEVVGEPGKTVRKEFYIQNISSQPMPVSATLDRLRPYEQEIDLKASESFNASQWIELDKPHHILDVEERRKVTATISVPKNAEPGGHYATIIWQPVVPATGLDGNSAKIAPQVGILVFITVPGDAKYDIALEDQLGWLQLSNNITIDPRFTNTGTIHILPTTKVVVRNIIGSVKDEIELKPSIVLPNTIKEFPAKWDGPGIIGIYSAETVATYCSGQTELTSGKHYFVVFRPLPLLFVIILLYFVGRFVRQTHPRWLEAIRAFREAGKKQK
jgi:hypothetical protein